jgi:hypothetical protein
MALGTFILFGALAASAFSPGPATRLSLLPLGVCEGGASDGAACLDDFDCEGPGSRGSCTTELSKLAVRGVLTLIADKDSAGFDDTSAVAEEPDERGTPIPVDLTRSTLSVMLEFKHRGKKHVLTETYQDLGDYVDPGLGIDCRGFCVPTWREPAVEARIASLGGSAGGGGGSSGGGGGTGGGGGQNADGTGIRIQWAPGGAAMQAALIDALGLPPGSVAFLEAVSEREIFDHSAESDVLASVRRMQVIIRVILPAGAP